MQVCESFLINNRYGQVEIVNTLLTHGADINVLDGGPMKEAEKFKRKEVLAVLKAAMRVFYL